MYKRDVYCMIVCVFLIGSLFTYAVEKRIGEGTILYPKLTQTPPKIDGVLDDPAWQEGPIVTGPFILNQPVYGEMLPQKTEVRLTYDYDNIYLAFYCYDTEPGKIKTSINKRDDLGNDDWVGVDLDTIGNRQFTYEHYCNPNGIQADLLNSVSGGEKIEPDWVWSSAGKVVNDGYIIEMRIPLKSLNFKSGNNVVMNLAFYRFVSRTGANASWPQIDQQKGYFNSLVPVVFEKLNPQLRLEAYPTFTYGSIRDRISPSEWSKADHSTQVGLGVKYGITSSINAEITVNPDFSQVESDEFQVVANQRYPLFYTEKRPFFMEIQNHFNVAGLMGNSNMSTTVHTRNIIDPAWGGKITGDLGKISTGILAAGDEWGGEGKNANFLFGRLKYSLKGDSYLGLIYTGRKFGDDSNHVIGGDFRFRLKGNHNISFNGLYSRSKDPETLKKTNGGAFTLLYDNIRKPLDLLFFVEHYARDFRMDSAYYYRTGITTFSANIGPSFYPEKEKLPWLKRIRTLFTFNYTHDLVTGMNDTLFKSSLSFRFPLQGYLGFSETFIKEAWAGKSFNQNKFGMDGNIQLTNWFYIYSAFNIGRLLYYGGPFLGDRIVFYLETKIQPSDKFTQEFQYQYQRLKRASDHEKVYNLDLLISRTTYQFNKYLFLRALIQYDSYSKIVLTDILGSFTLIPGTVIYLGYGSIHSKQSWDMGPAKYYRMVQSFFFKASYLIRF